MMQTDLITVVIPNYNGIRYIEDCLDSILAGTLVPQIVVVDNGSTDGSRERIAQRYPSVVLLALPCNTGFCHAVNAGLHITRTPYAMLLNNDTRVDPACVARLLETMTAHPRLFSVQALMLSMQDPETVDDAGDLYSALGWGFARAKGKPRGKVSGDRLVRIFAACAGAALYRMSVFEEIGWFDERHYCYLEDIDIGWRAQLAGYGNRMDPRAVVYHAGSATSGSRYNAFKETMTAGNNACLLYKNMPFLQYWLNAPLWVLGRAVKRRYFAGMGLQEAYDNGIRRGEAMKAAALEQMRCERAGIPRKKGSLAEEACVSAPDQVIPLYLGAKIPFRLSALPRYLSIEGQLIAGCCRRLVN